MRPSPLRPRRQRGFTLAELMAGMAIGLAVVSLALGLLGLQLRDTRRQLADLRLTHDLQTIAELISRDLARAGHGLPVGAPLEAGTADPAIALGTGAEGVSIDYAAAPAAGAGAERFSYRLRAGTVEMAFGDGGWQALSDAGSMRVTRLELVPDIRRIALQDFCSRPCDSDRCPYQLQRTVHIRLQAQALGTAAVGAPVLREARAEARVRNDAMVGRCPS